MLDFNVTLTANEPLRYKVETELRRLGVGSWAAECLTQRELRYNEVTPLLEFLAGIPDGAFAPWDVALDENGDPR